jgi:hypothetical protein
MQNLVPTSEITGNIDLHVVHELSRVTQVKFREFSAVDRGPLLTFTVAMAVLM